MGLPLDTELEALRLVNPHVILNGSFVLIAFILQTLANPFRS